jgi:3,4-dihydroxy 2-butanone 4-phosphate synthase / GTP cyclohydrolase II
MFVYRHTIDQTEHIALVKGRIDPDKPTLVRMHRMDIIADALGHIERRQNYVAHSLRAITENEGPGVAVFLRDNSPTLLSDHFSTEPSVAHTKAIRDYGVGAQILLDLGVRKMVVMTPSSNVRLAGLDGYDLRIVGRVPIPGEEDDQ